jgi:hypothetical protein
MLHNHLLLKLHVHMGPLPVALRPWGAGMRVAHFKIAMTGPFRWMPSLVCNKLRLGHGERRGV